RCDGCCVHATLTDAGDASLCSDREMLHMCSSPHLRISSPPHLKGARHAPECICVHRPSHGVCTRSKTRVMLGIFGVAVFPPPPLFRCANPCDQKFESAHFSSINNRSAEQTPT
ncbi:hypothetical protein JOQ06_020744, partial [Pogonophryne albipinna]